MEYMENGSVLSMDVISDPVPVSTTKRYIRDALQGLEYLHYHHIIHRDIKPENLLLSSQGTCKIGDLGMSTVLHSTTDLLHEYTAGTAAYRPPEMCQGKGFSGQAADVWSLGVTMFRLLYAQLPFWGSSAMLLAQAIMEKELVWPPGVKTPEPIDDGCKRFISRMLQKDPKQRATVEQLLEDDWLTEGGQWQPDRSWREAEEKAMEERRGARGGGDGAGDDDEAGGAALSLHEIIVTPAEVSQSITLVGRLRVLVNLKRKMRQRRRALTRARSLSLDDRKQDRAGHLIAAAPTAQKGGGQGKGGSAAQRGGGGRGAEESATERRSGSQRAAELQKSPSMG